jgi:hypothetical protein
MKGFKRHIAAGAAVTAVFLVCALTLVFAAAPIAGTVESPDVQSAGAFSYASMVPDTVPAEAAPVTTSQTETDTVATLPAPVPPSPAVVDSSPEVPADDPEVDPAKKTDPGPTPVINPPKDLVGEFVPDKNPYVELKWDPNNNKKNYEGFYIYRVSVGEAELADPEPIDFTKKKDYKDKDIKPGETYVYWVTCLAKWGEESGPSNKVEIQTYNADPPAAPQGLDPLAIEPGVSIDWQRNTEKNVAGYNVYREKKPGKWYKLTKEPVADNHYYDKEGVAGDVYGVTAVNLYDKESEKAVKEAGQSVPVTYEEDDPSISIEGLWVNEVYEGPTNGKIRVAEDTGSKLHFRFTGRQVQMVAAKYWTCGSANIYVDGELVATVNMYSETPTYQVVDFDMPGLKHKEHVLTIEVLGSGNPVEPYNFVNIDAFVVR